MRGLGWESNLLSDRSFDALRSTMSPEQVLKGSRKKQMEMPNASLTNFTFSPHVWLTAMFMENEQ